ncbi:MAG: MltA domain-containing protein [Pseudomonadota bacterium]
MIEIAKTVAVITLATVGLVGCAGVTSNAPTPLPRTNSVAEPLPPPIAPEAPDAFAALPGWDTTNPASALEAFERSCSAWSRQAADAFVWDRTPYAGRVSDWLPVCEAVTLAADAESAKSIMEALLVPLEIEDQGDGRFTGYYEPVIEARRRPEPGFTEPVPALPSDLVWVDGAVFGGTAGEDAPAQRTQDGRLRPYPSRASVTASGVTPIAYAHPADVVFLQIQGSGRLQLPGEAPIRSAYAAHNGQPFRSIANWLIRRGEITLSEADLPGIRAWMDRATPDQVRQAINANPRMVFFLEEAIDNPSLGPRGALGVPLTPFGSIAVDPQYHALGLPMYAATSAPGLGGTWSGVVVAQDTGGAIKGPVRGDLYFGTGVDAGRRATTLNAPGRLWVFLPRIVANRLPIAES